MRTKPSRRAFATLLTLAAVAVVVSTPAAPKLVTAMIAYVQLQPTTPGTAETGHSNITGTAKSGSVETAAFKMPTGAASGKVLTSDGAGVGTWQAPYFPVPFVATSNVPSGTVYATNTATNGTAVVGNASSATGANFGGWFGTSSTAGAAVQGYASATSGVNKGGNFLTASPAGYGVYAQNLATTGTPYSIYGFHAAPAGAAMLGWANATTGTATGGLFRSNAAAGSGITGDSTGATGYGGYFKSSGTSGRGVYGQATSTSGFVTGGRFDSASPSGVGVYGYASATTGTTYGGYFYNVSTGGRAMGAIATATTGAPIGVFAETRGPSGRGVWSTATSMTGFNYAGWFETKSNQGIGVYGLASGAGGSGVYGAAVDPTGYGVYSYGKFAASGTKSFRIDHPLDPENKYLNHYCAEGPLPQNLYNGQTVTDAKGYAWIDLPAYCQEINKDFLYQLTVIDSSDDFVMAKVTKPIANNRFQVRTSKGGVRICWEVKGTRNDRWMRQNGAPVEQDKAEHELGKYQHPELYGLPKERGTRYQPEVKAPVPSP